jgi:translation initiation factor 4A
MSLETIQNDNSNSIDNWDDLNCDMKLIRGIYSYGFEKPSPIQQKSIKPIIDKKDVIAQAQSGTGKTGCFAIASLALIDYDLDASQIIILAPTRELAEQIKKVVDNISQFLDNFSSELLIGGIASDENIRNLKKNPKMLIGCPGRIYDMLQRKFLSPQYIKTIVIDEADEMLSSGFKEQIYNIFQKLPTTVQVALFSATLPYEIRNLTNKFMRDPIEILVKNEQLTLEGINQYFVNLNDDHDKFETIKDLFSNISVSQCIIYCNSIQRVNDLYDSMKNEEFPVCRIHSNMTKEERSNNYRSFLTGDYRVLISSNVTARGIDIQQVSTVVNFDIPNDVHTYLHRIGRSGRFGRKGLGINFITKKNFMKLVYKNYPKIFNTLFYLFFNKIIY